MWETAPTQVQEPVRGSRPLQNHYSVVKYVSRRAYLFVRILSAGLDVLRLAVAKSRVVTPATIEQFVTLEADRCEISIRLIVEQTISEFGETRPRAAGNDLIEWIEGIECISRNARCGMGRRVRRFCMVCSFRWVVSTTTVAGRAANELRSR